MSSPKVKKYATGDRLHVQAQRIWLILVAFVMHSERNPKKPSTTFYGDLALAMGYADRRAGHTLGRQLGIIAQFCRDNDLPALNSIVIGQDTLQPGAEVMLRDGKTVKEEQAAVMKQDWFEIRVPTTGTFRRVWEGDSADADDE
jgi:hypothetical protein